MLMTSNISSKITIQFPLILPSGGKRDTVEGRYYYYHFDLNTVYHIMNEFTDDRRHFDGSVLDVNRTLLIHDDENLKRQKGYFTTILNYITSGKGATLVDG